MDEVHKAIGNPKIPKHIPAKKERKKQQVPQSGKQEPIREKQKTAKKESETKPKKIKLKLNSSICK